MAQGGGGTTGVNFSNDVDCFCCLGATDVSAELDFIWAAVDGTHSMGTADLDFLAGPRINLRACPGTFPSWDVVTTWCNVDGTNYYVYAQNAAISLQLIATGPLPLVDGSAHTMRLDLVGASVVFSFDGAVKATGTLNSTGSPQTGTNQLPLPHFLYGGFELFRPGVPPNYDVGPLPLSKVTRFRAWTTGPISPIINGIMDWVGNFVTDAAGNYLCWE